MTYDLLRVRRFLPVLVDAAALAIGMAAVIGPLVLLGILTGAMQSWYEMTIVYSMRNYAADADFGYVTARLLEFARISWQWYMVVALCGAAIWQVSRPRDTLAATLIVGLVVVGSAISQKKGFTYHIGGALVVLTLLNVYFLMEVVRFGLLARDRRTRLLLLILPLTLFSLGLASKCNRMFRRTVLWEVGAITQQEFLHDYDFDDVIEVAQHVARTTNPSQTVLPYTRHLMVCTLADRVMPIHFSTGLFLRASKPSPLADSWRNEIQTALVRHPPELIIMERAAKGSKDFHLTDNLADYEPLYPIMKALQERYHLESDIGRFALFRLDKSG